VKIGQWTNKKDIEIRSN